MNFSSRFDSTGGAYGTPHCDPLRLVLVGGMGSIGDNLLVEEQMRAGWQRRVPGEPAGAAPCYGARASRRNGCALKCAHR